MRSTTTLLFEVYYTIIRYFAVTLVGMLLASLCIQVFATEPLRHPMDPLTATEYSAVIKLLKDDNYIDKASRFPLITLSEPPKEEVKKWKSGMESPPRKAFVIVKKGPETFESIIDITKGKVVSWKQVSGVQPGILLTEDWLWAQRIVRSDPEWQAAIRKRGINNLQDVVCIPHTIGYHGIPEEEGHRLVKVTCYDSRGIKNFWGRPIEGLIAVVDHDKREVVNLIDTGVLPIPDTQVDFDVKSVGKLRKPPNPISIVQPDGPGFEINGHAVNWQKWQFHFRIDPRVGLVVSMVRYNADGKERSILYQGSLSELFVPYMDPDIGWYFKAYLDAGEYGVGKLAANLQPGLDCPPNAVLFDAVFADDWGNPYTQNYASCIFERYTGDIAWRHYEPVNRQTEVRKSTELVLRFIPAIGSYDYIFDWVFRQDGSIKVSVGSTGVTQVKAIKSVDKKDAESKNELQYGRLVDRNTLAINHDHYFCFRLDFDIDGSLNSLQIDQLEPKQLGNENLRKDIWVVNSRIVNREEEAKLTVDIQTPAIWRVINPNHRGGIGYPSSYHLKPGANAISLLKPNEYPQKRAGFTNYHLWVTPYDPNEIYAAGKYPNQSKEAGGLPYWTRTNRLIENTDIVLWYTIGIHHVVRSEDWPIMPTTYSEFELRPFDFFKHNPALDLAN